MTEILPSGWWYCICSCGCKNESARKLHPPDELSCANCGTEKPLPDPEQMRLDKEASAVLREQSRMERRGSN